MTLFALRLPHGLTLLSVGLYPATEKRQHPTLRYHGAPWLYDAPVRVLALWVGTRCFTWRLP